MALGEVGECGDVGINIEPLFLELAEALKCPHFGRTYSVYSTKPLEPVYLKRAERSAAFAQEASRDEKKRKDQGEEILTGIFPHAHFHQPIMIEALLANEGVSRRGGINERFVAAK